MTFLYVLMRDHLTPGVVEQLVREHAEKTPIGPYQRDSYSNKHLARYAVEISKRLTRRKTAPSAKRQEAARKAGLARVEKRKKAEESGNAGLAGNSQ